jgi:CheY-like chemotaxis protein
VHTNKPFNDGNKTNNNSSNLRNPTAAFAEGFIHDNRIVAIDTIKLDEHSRLTLTKSVKNVFPIEPGDKIAVYQKIEKNKSANELIFKIQREGNTIVDTWTVRRNISVSDIQVPNNATPIKINQKESDNDKGNNNQEQKNNNSKINNNKIMLVDDEADLLLVFKTILSSQGYDVETFSNSQEALRRFLETNNNNSQCQIDTHLPYYGLVILDIRMSGLNGTQLYQILKALSTNIKVLFISGLDAAQEIVSMLPSVKSTDIIQKPIEANHFLKKVSEAITAPYFSLFFTLVSLIQIITSTDYLGSLSI